MYYRDMSRKVAIVLGIVILILLIGFVILELKEEKGISLEEKQQIEAWLKANDLNQYGDPKDTAYTGGTPLFNEKTGETIDRYEYILRKHPDRPWLK